MTALSERVSGLARTVAGEEGDAAAAVAAGLVAGAAFVVTMEGEFRLGGRRLDDLLLLGRPVARDPRAARLIGGAIHAVNSAAFGLVYARFAGRLAGPGWWRGVVFATVENSVIYPLLVAEDRHPAIRAGEIDRYWSWGAYLQTVPRHVVYGAVLGGLYGRWRRG